MDMFLFFCFVLFLVMKSPIIRGHGCITYEYAKKNKKKQTFFFQKVNFRHVIYMSIKNSNELVIVAYCKRGIFPLPHLFEIRQ